MNDTATAVLQLDPQVLITNSPTNVRVDLGDLDPLVTSVRSLGIIEPVVVAPHDDGWRIIAGQRRCHAAVQAGLATVPAIARPDLIDEHEIAAQLVENLQRKDLTVGERAKGFEQLTAFGLTAPAIAKRTGTKTAEVRQSLKVATSDVAVTVASRYDLTLEHALALCEFDDDHDAIKTLTVTAQKEPERFDHVAARLRRDRESRSARQALLDELAAKNVPVITAPTYGHREPTRRLSDLTDAKGRPLTPAKHARCAGHAASVNDWEPITATYWCTDPKGHSHLDRYASPHSTERQGPMSDEDKAERRTVIENNKAWIAATDVRLAYLRNLLAGRTVPKGTLRWATTEIVTNPSALSYTKEEVFADILGDTTEHNRFGNNVGPAAVEGCAEARLPLVLAAQAAARLESVMGKHTWRHQRTAEVAYFLWLASTGYTLSAVEQLVVDLAATGDQRAQDEAGLDEHADLVTPTSETTGHDGEADPIAADNAGPDISLVTEL